MLLNIFGSSFIRKLLLLKMLYILRIARNVKFTKRHTRFFVSYHNHAILHQHHLHISIMTLLLITKQVKRLMFCDTMVGLL